MISGVPLPPPYLGVKVYFQDRGGRLSVHTTVYDREFSYPYHIVRYPGSLFIPLFKQQQQQQ